MRIFNQIFELTVLFIYLFFVVSVGDALRDINSRTLIKSNPFILVRGDIVANFDLQSVIEIQKFVHLFCDFECLKDKSEN